MQNNLKKNNEIVENRFEILFAYDVEEGNPNGDPLNENRPRIDEETGENIVTDVRLKRTVRDYFLEKFSGESPNGVFIRPVGKEDGTLKTREELVKDEIGGEEVDLKEETKDKVKEALFDTFLDMRLFGATLAVENMSIGQIGPVQFKMGRSLHKVDSRYIQQSVTLPSEEGKETGTFADRYDLPYSLISFYGIVNENMAEETGLTYSDVYKLLDGLWNGTKSLITHSKIEHDPKMLLAVEYSEDSYHIGSLDKMLNIESDKEDESIRSFSEVSLELEDLWEVLQENSDRIKQIHYEAKFPIDFPEKLEVEELEL